MSRACWQKTKRAVIVPSLFNEPGSAPLPAASGWITTTLSGSVAVSLCVLAVAFAGVMLMTGSLTIRDAARAVIGCFLLLGAQFVAAGLTDAGHEVASTGPASARILPQPPEASPLAPSTYDPYAGASLRTE